MLHKLFNALGVWIKCWKIDHFTLRFAPGFFQWSTSLLNPTNYRWRQVIACLPSLLKEAGPQTITILQHRTVSPITKMNPLPADPRLLFLLKAACISTPLRCEQLFTPCRCPGECAAGVASVQRRWGTALCWTQLVAATSRGPSNDTAEPLWKDHHTWGNKFMGKMLSKKGEGAV